MQANVVDDVIMLVLFICFTVLISYSVGTRVCDGQLSSCLTSYNMGLRITSTNPNIMIIKIITATTQLFLYWVHRNVTRGIHWKIITHNVWFDLLDMPLSKKASQVVNYENIKILSREQYNFNTLTRSGY